MMKAAEKYMKAHPAYNALVHALGGVGVGILITYPIVGAHPIRWGILFLALSVAGHLYALTQKRK